LQTHLAARQHCLRPISSFDPTRLVATHAGEVPGFSPLDVVPPGRVTTLDRGTQMALAAAQQAMAQARLDDATRTASGVVVGYSGSPQYQNMRVYPDQKYPMSRLVALYAARSTPQFQADFLARHFGLGGVRCAFSSASLSGLLALSHAMDLLRAGHAPAMLVGGGEINTLMNAMGMDGLGVTGPGPCTPFCENSGIVFGDGAALFVLERRADAARRGAPVLAELVAAGISADAYSDVAQDPSGRGLMRAMRKSLRNAGIDPTNIGWIRACGTGARDLDAAEAIALCAVFADAPPPVTSTEPYFSHVNGVSPLLGLAAVLAAMESGQAPAMPPTTGVRPGIVLPLLAPGALPVGDCLLTATAFGGTNGALVVRAPGRVSVAVAQPPGNDIIIAGMGAVSPLGETRAALLGAFSRPPTDRTTAYRVDDAWLRQSRPGLNVARRERLVRMALLAAHEAVFDAGADVNGSERYGLLVGLSRGPLAAYERFFDHTLRGRFDATTGRALLRVGRFSVASEIAHSFGLLGYSAAMAPGVHGGVQLLAHGAELLRATPDLDGLLVVAADEWTPLLAQAYARLGLLGDGKAYNASASGCLGGEGAAAILLHRAGSALPTQARRGGGWARISGCGFAGDTTPTPDPTGRAFSRAIDAAITRAGCAPEKLRVAFGQGCGWTAYDRREQAALRGACPAASLTSVVPYTGLVETAGGLFAAMAAAACLSGGALPEMLSDRAPQHSLVMGSSERGAHAAVVLSRVDAA
jgi:3-oxoacyl-[acyl-carrier-protein] synthase II